MKATSILFRTGSLAAVIAVLWIMCLSLYADNGSGQGNNNIAPAITYTALDTLSSQLMVILATEDFNGDGWKDTLKAELRQQDLRTVPYRARLLCWGRTRDSLNQLMGATKFTQIIYPGNYIGLRVPVAVVKYNQDTLPDILFTLKGRVKHGQDTVEDMKMIAVFGQPQLYEQEFIELGTIKKHQKKPYHALLLKENTHLKNKAKRDYTDNYSWELPRISVNLEDTSSELQQKSGGNAAFLQPALKLFPNPAIYTTTIAADSMKAGIYRVKMITSNGEEATTQEIRLEKAGHITGSLDLSRLATGYYMILLYKENTFIGSYPIIVTH